MFLGGKSQIDNVEFRKQTIRHGIPTATRWAHRRHQLYLADIFRRLRATIVPRHKWKKKFDLLAKKRRNCIAVPKSVTHPLSQKLEGWLGSVDLFHGHVEVVHVHDHYFSPKGNVNSLCAFFHFVLDAFLRRKIMVKKEIHNVTIVIGDNWEVEGRKTWIFFDEVWADMFNTNKLYLLGSKESRTDRTVDVFPVPTGPDNSTGNSWAKRLPTRKS